MWDSVKKTLEVKQFKIVIENEAKDFVCIACCSKLQMTRPKIYTAIQYLSAGYRDRVPEMKRQCWGQRQLSKLTPHTTNSIEANQVLKL